MPTAVLDAPSNDTEWSETARNYVRVTLTGTTPLMLHNGRLANPLDPHTRELRALTSKRKKTDEDLAAIMIAEARGAAYETEDGLIGWPDAGTWRSMQEAAKAFRRGRDISRAVIYNPVHVSPLLIAGESVPVSDYLADLAHIDYRPVKVQGRTVMRSRPIIDQWSISHEFEFYRDIIDLDEITQYIEHAGRLYGIGDHRPQYGRFNVTVEVV